MLFNSKASTLKYLSGKVKNAEILPIFTVAYGEWKKSGYSCLSRFISRFADDLYIVRSSCDAEDTLSSSMAGHFTSILNVNGENALSEAVDRVFGSYESYLNSESEVLIQPMLKNVVCSGVAFSKDPNNGGHYFVVNYAPNSQSTEAVTSGNEKGLKVDYWYRYAELKFLDWRDDLLCLLIELERTCDNEELDVEFAIDSSGRLFLLQVRPLIIRFKLNEQQILDQQKQLRQLQKKIIRLSERHPYLCGQSTIFANMPDWNPAEIIGTRPKPLALSLYKELVTDSIWAFQRHNYGYRNLQSFPLLVSFAQSPYIDVRVSFNSFVPKELSNEIAEKLVNYYLKCLAENPQLQDKVEFDIVFSCYHLNFEKKSEILIDNGFDKEEVVQIEQALKRLTNFIVSPQNEVVRLDLEKIKQLEINQHQILSSGLNSVEKIYWLIEDCKRYGTLPFAGIARAAFISRQILSSIVERELLSQKRADCFLNSLHAVGSQMLADLRECNFAAYIEKYGHLRPGTYDICSLRYDEMPPEVFRVPAGNDESPKFVLTDKERDKISNALENSAIECNADELFHFFKMTLEGRESAKFFFTKSISDVLKLLHEFGEPLGHTREDLAYLNAKDLMSLYSESLAANDTFLASIARHKKHMTICQGLNLPPVIASPEDVYRFTLSEGQPNFVTRTRVKGYTESDLSRNIKGKIIFIPFADPGFDWIFSHGIKGFITMYGGVNSHMAIRACELNIPAVIGAGQVLYEKWSRYTYLLLDSGQGKVECL
jgi:phosphohistidine swiveling domain-containing protein